MLFKLRHATLLFFIAAGAHAQDASVPVPLDDSVYDWLEPPLDPAAVAWGQARTDKAMKELLAHPDAPAVLNEVRAVSRMRSSTPPFIQPYSVLGDKLARFVTDADHPSGAIQVARLGAQGAASPWRTVLDIDVLNKTEGQVFGLSVLNLSTSCLPPEYRRCLIPLGIRGSEIVQTRELDLETGAFVPGFEFSTAKTEATWLDENTLVAAQAVPGDTLKSGFPSTARLWKRGTPYSGAKAVFIANAGDSNFRLTPVGLNAGRKAVISRRRERNLVDTYVVGADGVVTPTNLPTTVPFPGNLGLSGGTSRYVAVITTEPTMLEGRAYPEGSVFAYDTEDGVPAAKRLGVIYAPPQGTYLHDAQFGVAHSRSGFYLVTTRNFTQTLLRATPASSGWTVKTLRTAAKGNSMDLWGGSLSGETIVMGEEGYLSPPTISLVQGDHCCVEIASRPAAFDARKLVVEVRTAVANDGVEVDYYLVRPRDRSPGPVPTILSAYAGGGAVTSPSYAANLLDGGMISWFNRGGAYAFAAARGGGEKGRAWFLAGSGRNKARTLDDVAAVGQDLIKSGFTTSARLGLTGRSYGGLMAAGVAVRWPSLFAAVLPGVPVTDPLRVKGRVPFLEVLAADLGDPDDPEDRKVLLSYFPFQNVRYGVTYPRILLVASTSDDRVGPGPSRRLAAKLETVGADPLLIQGSTGGHIFPRSSTDPEVVTAEVMFFVKTLMSKDSHPETNMVGARGVKSN